MYTEKRKEQRSAFARQPQGTLHVLVDGRSHRVAEVQDMSHRGIRLRMDNRLAIGENLQIRYQTPSVDLKLNGTVVWNSDWPSGTAANAACVIGVELASPSLLETFW